MKGPLLAVYILGNCAQNSNMATENTRIPFGRVYKGRKLKDCPDSYLRWVATHLINTDFHEYALAAKQLFGQHEAEDTVEHAIEDAADKFLRENGVDPNDYK